MDLVQASLKGRISTKNIGIFSLPLRPYGGVKIVFFLTSLWNINTRQLGLEVWDELGDLFTIPLRLQVTCLRWDVLVHGELTTFS